MAEQTSKELLRQLGSLKEQRSKCPQGRGNFNTEEFTRDSIEFNLVSKMMNQTIKKHRGNRGGIFSCYNLVKVERIWNQSLLDKYESFSKTVRLGVGQQPAKDRLLYHGTSPNVLDKILSTGFDKNETSPNGMFGGGFYFADISSKANQYVTVQNNSNKRKMLICRVLLGNMKTHHHSERFTQLPPGFHSVKGVPSDTEKGLNYPEYVVYESKQIYPELVVTYKLVA